MYRFLVFPQKLYAFSNKFLFFTGCYRHTHCFVLICPFFVYVDTFSFFFFFLVALLLRISMVSGWQEVEEVCILLFFLGKWSDSYMFREMVKLGIKNLMNVDMV